MSLTSILKDKNRTNLKDWLKTNFPNPGISQTKEIIVKPSIDDNNYSSSIGIAFDYLMRIHLKSIQEKNNNTFNFIADEGFNRFTFLFKSEIMNPKSKKIDLEFLEKQEIKFNNAKEIYFSYNHKKGFTNEIIDSAILFAFYDKIYRSGRLGADLFNDQYDNKLKKELIQLLDIVPWESFIANDIIFLNPSFGKGSTLVGGADGDFIIDTTLIDIKSSKHLKIERTDLNQILGYFFLSNYDILNGGNSPKIDTIGIYFARFSYLWTINIDNFISKNEYNKKTTEFINLLKDKSLFIKSEKSKLNKFPDLPDSIF